jgi:hypothetical protein
MFIELAQRFTPCLNCLLLYFHSPPKPVGTSSTGDFIAQAFQSKVPETTNQEAGHSSRDWPNAIFDRCFSIYHCWNRLAGHDDGRVASVRRTIFYTQISGQGPEEPSFRCVTIGRPGLEKLFKEYFRNVNDVRHRKAAIVGIQWRDSELGRLARRVLQSTSQNNMADFVWQKELRFEVDYQRCHKCWRYLPVP